MSTFLAISYFLICYQKFLIPIN